MLAYIKKSIWKIIDKLPIEYHLALAYKGSLQRKLKYLSIAKMVKSKGVVELRIQRLADWYTNDWFNFTQASKEDKLFYINNGYAPYKINRYGVTRDNIGDYLSDFELYSPKHYVDKRFVELFEHKLNTYYLLSPFCKNMPKHFWYISKKGDILPIDVPNKAAGKTQDLIDLLDTTPIAAKACLGGHGRGFYKIEKKNKDFYINDKECSESEVERLYASLRNYIITEYKTPHKNLRNLCGEGAYAVIRTVSVFDKEYGSQVTGAMIRLGCKKAGIVSDYDGTIYTGIGLEDGKLFAPYIRVNETLFERIEKHPDTGFDINGITIQYWDELKKTVEDITKYIPWAPYLVIDIIPTDDGFKILEINSHGEVQGIEGHYPFCKNKYNRRAFGLE